LSLVMYTGSQRTRNGYILLFQNPLMRGEVMDRMSNINSYH